MAGNYPDAPAQKIPYDRDGTVGHFLNWGSYHSLMSATDLSRMNDWTFNGVVGPSWWNGYMLLIFPRLMDLVAIYTTSNNGNVNLQDDAAWSPDTTNGFDGTWNAIAAWPENLNQSSPSSMRANPTARSVTGMKALRLANHTQAEHITVHLYGHPSASETERLEIIEPATAAAVGGAHFDYAEIEQGTSGTKQFRVSNLSSTFTAGGVVVQAVDGIALEFSTDDVTYAASLSIGDLAPGAVSDVLYARRTVAAGASLGLGFGRFEAVPSSWT